MITTKKKNNSLNPDMKKFAYVWPHPITRLQATQMPIKVVVNFFPSFFFLFSLIESNRMFWPKKDFRALTPCLKFCLEKVCILSLSQNSAYDKKRLKKQNNMYQYLYHPYIFLVRM